MANRALVRGTGIGLPQRAITNDELALRVDTSDEWIRKRTGIGERRICEGEENLVSLATLAAREAMANSGVPIETLDLIVCATVTPDRPSPSTASYVQRALGAPVLAAFDVGAACAGFIYAASIVAAMIETGRARTALVVGADTLTRHVDWNDRSTCVLFGDGAGAAVLTAGEDGDRGIVTSLLFGDGRGVDLLRVEPPQHGVPGGVTMAGSEVFRFAVGAMVDACLRVLESAGLGIDDIDLFVPHQANQRIIEAACERLGLDMAKVFVNVERYGNTGGASVPIALHEASQTGRLVPRMRIMTVGFGAGLVWGANIIVW